MAVTERAFPFASQSNSESDWSKVIGALADTGVISGLAITAGSGMQVIGAIGNAIVRGFYYESTGDPKPLAVAASDPSNARKDYVILKLDLTADSIVMAVKTGVATSGGGTLPALTQNSSVWEHPIGIITVPAGASNIVSGNIAQLAAGIGLRVIPYQTGQRPSPVTTAIGIDTTARIMEIYVGGSWYSLNPTPAWSDITGKPATFTPSAHTHAWADLVSGVPATFPPSAHDHDTRYYQKSEVDTFLAGKSATGHTHAASDVTSGTFNIARIPTIPSSLLGTGNWNMGTATLTTTNVEAYGNVHAGAVNADGQINGGDIHAYGGLQVDLAIHNSYGRSHGVSGGLATYLAADGTFGVSSSSKRFKKQIKTFDVDAQAVLAMRVVEFVWKETGELDHGVIAEELDALGLKWLVFYEDDDPTQPRGVHYEKIALALLPVLQDHEARLAKIEKALA